MKRNTQCVHSGNYIDPITKGINSPVFTSSVFGYINSGKQPYPRYFNTPNQEFVVEKLCALEGAELITPALTSHRKMSEEDRNKIGINNRLLRFSVGIEDVEDLKADINQAF